MRKILVPVDGSQASIKAAKVAAEFAQKYASELVFFGVVEATPGTYLAGDLPLDMHKEAKASKEENDIEKGQKILDFVISKATTSDMKFEKKVIAGTASERIVEEAVAGKYDLIVMGRRGFSPMKRFFVGSTTERVLAEAPCDIYVAME